MCVLPCISSGLQLLSVPIYKNVLKVGEMEPSLGSHVGVRGDSQEIAVDWPVGQRSH